MAVRIAPASEPTVMMAVPAMVFVTMTASANLDHRASWEIAVGAMPSLAAAGPERAIIAASTVAAVSPVFIFFY